MFKRLIVIFSILVSLSRGDVYYYGNFLRNVGTINRIEWGKISPSDTILVALCSQGLLLYHYPDGALKTIYTGVPATDVMIGIDNLTVLTMSSLIKYSVYIVEGGYIELTVVDSVPYGGYRIIKVPPPAGSSEPPVYAVAKGPYGIETFLWSSNHGFVPRDTFNITAYDLDIYKPKFSIPGLPRGPFLVVTGDNSGAFLVDPYAENNPIVSTLPTAPFMNFVRGVHVFRNYAIVTGGFRYYNEVYYKVGIYDLRNFLNPSTIYTEDFFTGQLPLVSVSDPYFSIYGLKWSGGIVPETEVFRYVSADSVALEYTVTNWMVSYIKLLSRTYALWANPTTLYEGKIGRSGIPIVSMPENLNYVAGVSIGFLVFDANRQIYWGAPHYNYNTYQYTFTKDVLRFDHDPVYATSVRVPDAQKYAVILDDEGGLNFYEFGTGLNFVSRLNLVPNPNGVICGTPTGYLYVLHDDSLISVIEINDPFNPALIGEINFHQRVIDFDIFSYQYSEYPQYLLVGIEGGVVRIYRLDSPLNMVLEDEYQHNSEVLFVDTNNRDYETAVFGAAFADNTYFRKELFLEEYITLPDTPLSFSLDTYTVGAALGTSGYFMRQHTAYPTTYLFPSNFNALYGELSHGYAVVAMGEYGIDLYDTPVGVAESDKYATKNLLIENTVVSDMLQLKGNLARGTIKVFDSSGRMILRKHIEHTTDRFDIPVYGLPDGVYYLYYLANGRKPPVKLKFIKLRHLK